MNPHCIVSTRGLQIGRPLRPEKQVGPDLVLGTARHEGQTVMKGGTGNGYCISPFGCRERQSQWRV